MSAPPPHPLLDMRAPGFGWTTRFDVVAPTLDVLGAVHPQSGDLSVSVDTEANVVRTMRGVTLGPNEARDLDLYRDRLRPVMVLEDGSEWPLGVFLFAGITPQVTTGFTLVDATLCDFGFALDQALTYSAGVPADGALYPAMTELVERAGVWDYVIDYTEQRTREPLNWPVGTRTADCLNYLSRLAGYLRPYFDNQGRLVWRAAPALSGDVAHVYNQDTAARIVDGTLAPADNLLDAPNVYVVIGSGPQRAEVVARAYVDPRLPHSRERRGFEVPKVLRLQGVADTEHAQRVADTMAAEDVKQLRTVSWSSTPDPRHDVFDVVSVDGVLYREVAWSLNLGTGEHTHKASRQVIDFGQGTQG